MPRGIARTILCHKSTAARCCVGCDVLLAHCAGVIIPGKNFRSHHVVLAVTYYEHTALESSSQARIFAPIQAPARLKCAVYKQRSPLLVQSTRSGASTYTLQTTRDPVEPIPCPHRAGQDLAMTTCARISGDAPREPCDATGGCVGGSEGTGATNQWQRDLWSHRWYHELPIKTEAATRLSLLARAGFAAPE